MVKLRRALISVAVILCAFVPPTHLTSVDHKNFIQKKAFIDKIQFNRIPAVASQKAFEINAFPIEGAASIPTGIWLGLRINNPESTDFTGFLKIRITSPSGVDFGYQENQYRRETWGINPPINSPIKSNESVTVWHPLYVKTASEIGEWCIEVELWELKGLWGFMSEIVDKKIQTLKVISNESNFYKEYPSEIGQIVYFKDSLLNENDEFKAAFAALNLIVSLAQSLASKSVEGVGIGLHDAYYKQLISKEEVFKEALTAAMLNITSLPKDDDLLIKIDWRDILRHNPYHLNVCFDRAMIVASLPSFVEVVDANKHQIFEEYESEMKHLVFIVNKVDKRIWGFDFLKKHDRGHVNFIVKTPVKEFKIVASLHFQIGPFQGKPGDSYVQLRNAPLIYNYNKWRNFPNKVFWIEISTAKAEVVVKPPLAGERKNQYLEILEKYQENRDNYAEKYQNYLQSSDRFKKLDEIKKKLSEYETAQKAPKSENPESEFALEAWIDNSEISIFDSIMRGYFPQTEVKFRCNMDAEIEIWREPFRMPRPIYPPQSHFDVVVVQFLNEIQRVASQPKKIFSKRILANQIDTFPVKGNISAQELFQIKQALDLMAQMGSPVTPEKMSWLNTEIPFKIIAKSGGYSEVSIGKISVRW